MRLPCHLYDPRIPGAKDLLDPEFGHFPAAPYDRPAVLDALKSIGLRGALDTEAALAAAKDAETLCGVKEEAAKARGGALLRFLAAEMDGGADGEKGGWITKQTRTLRKQNELHVIIEEPGRDGEQLGEAGLQDNSAAGDVTSSDSDATIAEEDLTKLTEELRDKKVKIAQAEAKAEMKELEATITKNREVRLAKEARRKRAKAIKADILRAPSCSPSLPGSSMITS
eukprot:108870-Prorocentrum_minimum.AAC.1